MTEGGHESVTHVADERTGLKAIIAIHSTALGPALGGCRFHTYDSEHEALVDVLRLSAGMTLKNAAAGLDFGGGKAVVLEHEGITDRTSLLEAFGRSVDRLGGTYITAEDVGTSVTDLEVVARTTAHVVGLSEAAGGSGDPSPLTARGVRAAMRAAASHLWGEPSLEGRRIAIQGVGKVGGHLARQLVEDGVELVIADPDPQRVEQIRRATGATVVDPRDVVATACDIFAPCALGGVVSAVTIPRMRCAAIVGSANNQLATENDALRLRAAGIVYVPDFLANAGGVINIGVERRPGGYDIDAARRAVDTIGDRVLAVLRDDHASTSVDAAVAMAQRRLDSVA